MLPPTDTYSQQDHIYEDNNVITYWQFTANVTTLLVHVLQITEKMNYLQELSFFDCILGLLFQ
jgi:hypothetical protein